MLVDAALTNHLPLVSASDDKPSAHQMGANRSWVGRRKFDRSKAERSCVDVAVAVGSSTSNCARCRLLSAFVSCLMLTALLVTCNRGDALRMINLDAPQTAWLGDTIQLNCAYSLASQQADNNLHHAHRQRRHTTTNLDQPQQIDSDATAPTRRRKFVGRGEPDDFQPQPLALGSDDVGGGESLYAIKWYKDGREFFRYLTQDWPHKQLLPLEGLHVDVDKSDNQTVVLRNVSLKTSGLFKCEVSTDAPFFVTKSIERPIFIYSLPSEGPLIETLGSVGQVSNSKRQERHHYLNEQITLRCTTRESKPPAKIDWIINKTLNLSSLEPLNSNGAPIFHKTNRQLVRLPTTTTTNSIKPSIAPILNHTLHRQQSQAHRSDQSEQHKHLGTAPLATYELIQQQPPKGSDSNNQRRSSYAEARPINIDSPGPMLILPSGSLDQLLEIGSSTLNFTVDLDLFQLLTKVSASASAIGHHPDSRLAEQRSDSTDRGSRNKTLGTLSDSHGMWRKSSAVKLAYGGSTTISTTSANRTVGNANGKSIGNNNSINRQQMLQIKCVARVLHLSMSDEVKLRLVGVTRENGGDASSVVDNGIEGFERNHLGRVHLKLKSDRNSGSIRKGIQCTSNHVLLIFIFTFTHVILMNYL